MLLTSVYGMYMQYHVYAIPWLVVQSGINCTRKLCNFTRRSRVKLQALLVQLIPKLHCQPWYHILIIYDFEVCPGQCSFPPAIMWTFLQDFSVFLFLFLAFSLFNSLSANADWRAELLAVEGSPTLVTIVGGVQGGASWTSSTMSWDSEAISLVELFVNGLLLSDKC